MHSAGAEAGWPLQTEVGGGRRGEPQAPPPAPCGGGSLGRASRVSLRDPVTQLGSVHAPHPPQASPWGIPVQMGLPYCSAFQTLHTSPLTDVLLCTGKPTPKTLPSSRVRRERQGFKSRRCLTEPVT